MRIPAYEDRLHECFYEEYPFEILMYALLTFPIGKLDSLVLATALREDYRLACSPLKRTLDLKKEYDDADI